MCGDGPGNRIVGSMSGAFFQTEDSEDFDAALDAFNSFLERGRWESGVPAGEALELVKCLETMGLYEQAVSVVEKVPAGEMTDELEGRARAVREKKEKKEAVLGENFEKNIVAIEKSFPSLSARVREHRGGKILIAGDLETGYQLLAEDDGEYDDVTFLESDVREFRRGLEVRLEEIRAKKAIIFSDFLYCDVFLWLADETKGKRPESGLVMYVVEPDADIFSAVLRTHDLSDLFTRKRLVPFAGEGFEGQIEGWFDENDFALLPGIFVVKGDVWEEVMVSLEKVNSSRREKELRRQKENQGISGGGNRR